MLGNGRAEAWMTRGLPDITVEEAAVSFPTAKEPWKKTS